MSTIALAIHAAGEQFRFHLQADRSFIASNQVLSPEDSAAIREISAQFGALFETKNTPNLPAEKLSDLGERLFRVWFGSHWEAVQKALPNGSPRTLLIASSVSEILNLPWELVRPPERDFLGFDPQIAIRRFPSPQVPVPTFSGTLPPLPLRILFMACSPQNEPELDYEREEKALLRAIGNAGPNVMLDTGDLGTFEELQTRIAEFEPQVVHLTGHATLGRMCPKCRKLNQPGAGNCANASCSLALEGKPTLGYFAFEDERGNADLRSSVEMRQDLFSATSVQCAFISSCQAGKAPPIAALGGLCQGLVGEQVPFSIGWAASIADTIATEFAESFYKFLATGQNVDIALVRARQNIRKLCEKSSDPSWTLPVLYTASDQRFVFDKALRSDLAQIRRTSMVQAPLPGMTRGYSADFVNRRRELQRLLPRLRDGSIQALLITGLGGSGKSTLATRLARRLETFGFRPISIGSSDDAPFNTARLLDTCSLTFLDARMRDDYDTLRDAGLTVEDRCRHIVSVLNRNRFVLVLDNFETNLDESTHRILDPQVLDFYQHLSANLVGGSRLIVTSRYPPVV